ncbi:MAG: MMPL family transporter, partial [Bacteroidia bacterium]|nr:MMPL family transporter [Bacteroidia bacterium]
CSQFFNKLSEVKVENKSWLVWVVVVLTLVFGYYSFQTKFDSNLSNINYMTEVQRGELERFEQMLTSAATEETLYLMTTSEDIDDALDANLRSRDNLRKMLEEGKITSHATASRFIVSQREQSRRLERWNRFVEGKALQLIENIKKTGAELGFVSGAFGDFGEILSKRYEPQEVSYFEPLTKTVFSNYICEDRERGRYSVIDIITTPIDKISECREEIQRNEEKAYCFDVKTLNSSVADSLSDNFNYIGYMCGCIVFVFLWFSFGRIELAILSFIPMAVSWVWILGIMAIFDIQFNIVNVILATFIFGQGDDYTIFMTEGACYEYTYRKKMLASYRHSIILSALIMFIGIGSLIVAKHPALHSLAEVTIVGMFSVVLMAYLFPPLIYKFLVETRDGRERLWPISLVNIFSKHRDELPIESNAEECLLLAKNRYRYKGIGIEREVSERVDRYGKEAREISKRGGTIVVINGGYGELAMLIALSNRQARVVSMDKDIEKIDVARYSTEKISNVEIRLLEVEKMELKAGEIYVLVEPREDEIEYFNKKCQFSCIEFENVVILRR